MPPMPEALAGGMKRVNTVRSGECAASRATEGNAFSIHGVGHGPRDVKRFCMSTHR
jgi:hypothetical protein